MLYWSRLILMWRNNRQYGTVVYDRSAGLGVQDLTRLSAILESYLADLQQQTTDQDNEITQVKVLIRKINK
ncbi:hypothetical protein WAJ24_22720, partial [Acinetobacter baumannii]